MLRDPFALRGVTQTSRATLHTVCCFLFVYLLMSKLAMGTDYVAPLRDPSARQGSKVANKPVLRTGIFCCTKGGLVSKLTAPFVLQKPLFRVASFATLLLLWELTDSNRRPSACKADALNQLS